LVEAAAVVVLSDGEVCNGESFLLLVMGDERREEEVEEEEDCLSGVEETALVEEEEVVVVEEEEERACWSSCHRRFMSAICRSRSVSGAWPTGSAICPAASSPSLLLVVIIL
jgi:hypothetical protein